MSKTHTGSPSDLEAAHTGVAVQEARVRAKRAQIKEVEVRLRRAVRHLQLLRHTAPPATSAPARTVEPQPATGGALNAAGLRALTLELESAITWDAVSPDWRTRRDGWVKEVTAANSVSGLAKLIEELEVAVLWSAVTPSWAEQRPGWIQGVSQASTAAQLATQLGELEGAITWEAVTPAWKEARAQWVTAIAGCKAL